MIISTDQYTIRSQNDNNIYWEQGIYPDWTALSAYRHFPNGIPGTGVEPHYHDNDELWLFTEGFGEVWLNGERFDITPNTIVYTPMGCIHRFQMFTPYENNAIVTPLERQRRPIHITSKQHGPPLPTAPGFIVTGEHNTGPITDPGPRCPLSEWRLMTLNSSESDEETTLSVNEHWLVMTGTIVLGIDAWEIELTPHDIALLRAGTRRRLSFSADTRALVARER
jgi:mannose-6-phosphate isomerase-like protein (cupin superfamily)